VITSGNTKSTSQAHLSTDASISASLHEFMIRSVVPVHLRHALDAAPIVECAQQYSCLLYNEKKKQPCCFDGSSHYHASVLAAAATMLVADVLAWSTEHCC
jgi:hypothetical protein